MQGQFPLPPPAPPSRALLIPTPSPARHVSISITAIFHVYTNCHCWAKASHSGALQLTMFPSPCTTVYFPWNEYGLLLSSAVSPMYASSPASCLHLLSRCPGTSGVLSVSPAPQNALPGAFPSGQACSAHRLPLFLLPGKPSVLGLCPDSLPHSGRALVHHSLKVYKTQTLGKISLFYPSLPEYRVKVEGVFLRNSESHALPLCTF